MTSSAASSPIPNSASGSNNNNNNSNNNSNQFRDERVIFLKELARNADIDIYDLANQLSLSQESVMAYIRSFFKTVAEFVNPDDQLDKNGYGNVKRVINSNVSTEHGGLTDNHVQNLMYVYEKYRKLQPDLYIEADGIKANRLYSLPKQVSSSTQQPEMIAHSTGNSPPRNNDVDEEFRHVGPQDFEHNVDRLNKPHNYEFLGKLTRKGLVQWVLEGVPIPISTPKVENYIQYFEVNQDEIFISPSMLRSSLIDWFGDKTGDNAAKLIYSYLKFLPSSEGFGQQKLSGGKFKEGYFSGDNPLYQRPGIAHYPGPGGPSSGSGNPFAPNDGYTGHGPRMEDPYNTYYHSQGILPFGMNIYSVDARRLINEAEQKRKHKEEQREEQQEMMDMMRNKMSMSYAEMFDAKKFGFGGNGQLGGGGGNQIFTPDFLQGLVATTAITGIAQGKMQALPTQNPETGKMEVKLVPVSDGNAAALAAANAPPELGLKDMLELVKTMYDSVDRKRDEAMSFKIDTLKEVYGNKENKDPITQVGETFKALKEIVPGLDMKFQGGNGHDIELHRLLLEKDKFMYDREKTDKLIDHQLGMKEKKEEFEHENELAANKSRNTSLKMISNILASNLPMFINLIMTFLSMKNPKFAPFASMMGGGGMGGGGGQSGGGGMGGMGGITDLIGNLLKGVSGGDVGEDEEEDEDDSFMGAKKKKRERMQMDEDEDEIAEGGFNLGGLEGIVGQVTDLLKSGGMPGLNPMAGTNEQEEDGGGVVIPETRSSRHQHRHVHNRRGGGGGAGTRPTFRNIQIGNPNAAVVQMPSPGTEAVNAYDDIELQTRKRIATTPHPTSPTIEDIMRNSVVGQGQGGVSSQEYTNAYGDSDRIPGDMINEPQVIIPEAVSTTIIGGGGEGEESNTGDEQTKEGYPEYSTDDFKDWTVEQLHNAKKDGHDAAKSHESYLKSVEEVLRQKEES